MQLYQIETLVPMFSCEFWKLFKYTSQWLLLREHWIALQMVTITIANNISNAKELHFFFFLRLAYGNFVEISIATFAKVFLVLEFSLLTNVKQQLFQVDSLPSFLNSCFMLKLFKLQIISNRNVNKNISHKVYLRLSHVNP